MSKPLIEITFDRADRRYAPGEEITGSLRAQVDKESECQVLYLRRQWRTHGRGNRDSGEPDEIAVVKGQRWVPGATYTIPFHFPAPHSPATYHGHYLNVDWYVTAKAYVRNSRELWPELCKTETEFLVGSDAGLKVRNAQVTRPGDDGLPSGAVAGGAFILVGLALMVYILSVESLAAWPEALAIGLFFAGIGIIILATRILPRVPRILAELRLGRVAVQVEPSRAGDSIQISIQFSPRSEIGLERIPVELSVEEVAVAGSGSTLKRHRHTVFKERIVERRSQRVYAKQDHRAELSLKIPPDLPVTFAATDNAIRWTMTIQIVLDGWPNWRIKTPITVHR
jgi:hypothetical protein